MTTQSTWEVTPQKMLDAKTSALSVVYTVSNANAKDYTLAVITFTHFVHGALLTSGQTIALKKNIPP